MNGMAADDFDTLYAQSDDPWRVADDWYEIRKRRLLLAMLPRPRFASAYEPGCGTGELSAELAARCDRLLASDFSERALRIARRRLRHAPHVDLRRQTMPSDWPAHGAAGFDLIVVSEFAYYLPDPALQALAEHAGAALSGGGCLIACHWRRSFEERLQATEAMHAQFGAQPGLRHSARYRDADFLLDSWILQGPLAATESP
jgi:SAM-dependent methyltransferase